MDTKGFYFYKGDIGSIPKSKSIYIESENNVFRYKDIIIDSADLSPAFTPYDTRRA